MLFSTILINNSGLHYCALKSFKILRREPKVNHQPAHPRRNPDCNPLVTMGKRNSTTGSVSLLSLISHQAPKGSFQTVTAWASEHSCLSQNLVCFFHQGQRVNGKNLSFGNHYTSIHGAVHSLKGFQISEPRNFILFNKHWLLDVVADTFSQSATLKHSG